MLLRDILDEKRRRHDADADQFRAVVQYEFAAGLDATVQGAAAAMRRWVAKRPPWISYVQQARRVAVLAAIETAFRVTPEAGAATAPAGKFDCQRSFTLPSIRQDRGGRSHS